jgi:hypothetical protein
MLPPLRNLTLLNHTAKVIGVFELSKKNLKIFRFFLARIQSSVHPNSGKNA